MTRAVSYLPLGCLPRLLGWFLLLWGLRLAARNSRALLSLLGRFAGGILSFVFGPCWPCTLFRVLFTVIALSLLYVALRALLGERATRLKPGLGELGCVLGLGWRFISFFLKLLFVEVEGRQSPTDQRTRRGRR